MVKLINGVLVSLLLKAYRKGYGGTKGVAFKLGLSLFLVAAAWGKPIKNFQQEVAFVKAFLLHPDDFEALSKKNGYFPEDGEDNTWLSEETVATFEQDLKLWGSPPHTISCRPASDAAGTDSVVCKALNSKGQKFFYMEFVRKKGDTATVVSPAVVPLLNSDPPE